jgi:hypothetical protein
MIRENDGWDNWDFVVVEEYPCQNIIEATLRERYWVELKQAQLNTNIPSRTIKEWYDEHEGYNKKYYEENREELIEYQKKRYEENREELIEYQKTYHQKNREEYVDYQKKYYEETKDKRKKYQEENKNKIMGRRNERIICECGCEVKRANIAPHRKTQKHMNYLNQINNQVQANENDGCV